MDVGLIWTNRSQIACPVDYQADRIFSLLSTGKPIPERLFPRIRGNLDCEALNPKSVNENTKLLNLKALNNTPPKL